MADNIKLRKSNFTVVGGYYYTFDNDQDALLQKTDDGNTAFSYPLDTLLTSEVLTMEYDGVDFWTLEDGATDSVIIKRWRLDNYVCKLQETFNFNGDASHKYDVNCFTVEHYHTTLSATVSGGSSTLYLDKYHDAPAIIVGASLHLGPNTAGEFEDVTVSGTIYGGVTLTSSTTYQYDSGDEVNFNTNLWLLNNYNGTSSATGALYKFDSHTGSYKTKYSGGQYKDISACTFYTVPSFVEYGNVDTLAYVKGTNTLFVDVSEDTANIQDADTLNEYFTGTNGSSPDIDRWDLRQGSPTIQSNELYLSTTSGIETITSDYYLRGNFEVTISGSLVTSPTYSGSGYFAHHFGLLFPNESDRYCYLARGNNTLVGNDIGEENFHVLSYKTSANVDYFETAVISGTTTSVDDYTFKISRASDTISFYYQPVISGVGQGYSFIGNVTMFDSDCKILMGLENTTGSSVQATFDNMLFTSGEAVYFSTATALPYYGSMVMENIQSDQVTVIPVYDLAMEGDNLYRLQNIEDDGGSMSGYNYQLSSLSSFVTSISLSADPAIIAANGLSTSTIIATVKDQFLQPIVGRRVTFSENGDGSITGGTQINTDSEGKSDTVYTSGTTAQEVTITAVVEQTN